MPDWGEMMAREGRAVWATAYRILGNRADADECFQEAFLAAWEASHRGSVRNWPGLLRRLATARAVDRLRQRLRRGSAESPADWTALQDSSPSPSQTVEDAELSTALRHALAHLPPRQAEVFCLKALEGWSYAEIAAHLGESIDAVGVHLHRARQRLRALLEPKSQHPASLPAEEPVGRPPPAEECP